MYWPLIWRTWIVFLTEIMRRNAGNVKRQEKVISGGCSAYHIFPPLLESSSDVHNAKTKYFHPTWGKISLQKRPRERFLSKFHNIFFFTKILKYLWFENHFCETNFNFNQLSGLYWVFIFSKILSRYLSGFFPSNHFFIFSFDIYLSNSITMYFFF